MGGGMQSGLLYTPGRCLTNLSHGGNAQIQMVELGLFALLLSTQSPPSNLIFQ